MVGLTYLLILFVYVWFLLRFYSCFYVAGLCYLVCVVLFICCLSCFDDLLGCVAIVLLVGFGVVCLFVLSSWFGVGCWRLGLFVCLITFCLVIDLLFILFMCACFFVVFLLCLILVGCCLCWLLCACAFCWFVLDFGCSFFDLFPGLVMLFDGCVSWLCFLVWVMLACDF